MNKNYFVLLQFSLTLHRIP